jgi:hypothetical protein
MMSFYDLKVNGKIFAVFGPRQFVAKLAKLRAGVLLSTGTGYTLRSGAEPIY